MAEPPYISFVERAWFRFISMIGGHQPWSLRGRANQNAIVVRTMRRDRKRI